MPVWDDDVPPRHRQHPAASPSTHAPAYEARGRRSQPTGVAVVAIPGLHASTGHTLGAERGLDLGPWPHEQACGAWLGLAPRHEISGGNGWRRSPLKTRHRAGQAWQCAAQAAGRNPRGLGGFYRRRRARRGPHSAMVATAHKIARSRDHRLTHRPSCRARSPEA
jgi:transposase